MSRRNFHKTASGIGLGLTAMATGPFPAKVLGANERVLMGAIGLHGQGTSDSNDLMSTKNVQFIAACDVDQRELDKFVNRFSSAKPYHDFRDLIAVKEIDAVLIATPDHWHAVPFIMACEAGKDIYCEKPISHNITEGRAMVNAAKKFKRVVQIGSWQRSVQHFQDAIDFVRSGKLGKISVCRAWLLGNGGNIGHVPPTPAPEGFDWETYLGPAPKVRYNRNRAFYRFRWFYDYSGRQISNLGAHYLDFAHWALGHDTPLAVTAMGGKVAISDNREIPDTFEALWTYPGGVLVIFSQFNTSGAPVDLRHGTVEVRGTEGTLYPSWWGYEVVPERVTEIEFPALTPLDRSLSGQWQTRRKTTIEPRKNEGKNSTALRARNFLDCVRSRQRCNCDIETGHRTTTATLIANIAHKTHSYLEWDARAERFSNHPEANDYLSCAYRAPYSLPEV